MELLQLKYFQVVAKHEHMTVAAKELQIAQPSLSKTISRLEEDLGVPLFERENRRIRLNAYGKLFLERVEKIFTELHEGKRELLDLAGTNDKNITLAVSISRLLPSLIKSFQDEYPDVRFQQFLESTSSMKAELEQGRIDFCISSLPVEGEEIVWEPLMTEEICLIVPPAHRFSDRSAIALHEVKSDAFISMNTGFGFRDLTDRICKEAGFQPYVAFEGDEPGVIGELVTQGLGIAFIPEIALMHQKDRFPHKLRITTPDCKRTIGIGWSKRRYLSPTAIQFREFVKCYFEEVSYRLETERR
ncbi:LysR family transcriptional regulator [Bacillus salacetis]|uniref:LysR family transcriptional regulator n=1 Tax=Bacillus salacetis TaxID=2315464 RepID=A0A3A1QSR7_9BACI|nr:LysR substrate-binding domain-containing protein [Bacillus salacetis]RIW28451.1 LysR family transcriptional regulator [Bacillus salacetis]